MLPILTAFGVLVYNDYGNGCLLTIMYCKINHELRQVLRYATWFGGEGKMVMAEIKVGKNESLDSALRRFKRSCQKSGVLAEARKREHYEKPSVRKKKK